MSDKAKPPLEKGQTIKDERKMFRSEETTPAYAEGGPVRNPETKAAEEAAQNAAPKNKKSSGGGAAAIAAMATKQPAFDEGGPVNDIDADSIIDAFLDENPDLVDVPPDEWPEEAIKMLQDVINTGNVDDPNGVLPEEENAEGEPNDGQNFDIMVLADLVNKGDKDAAWGLLQSMFGTAPEVEIDVDRPEIDKPDITPDKDKKKINPKEEKKDKGKDKEENTLSRPRRVLGACGSVYQGNKSARPSIPPGIESLPAG